MTLNVPLAVRLITARADRHVTREIAALRYGTAVPEGFTTAALRLHRPLHIQPDEIDLYSRLIIYDGRSRNVMWEGRLDAPGRRGDTEGPVYDITAQGPSAHARDDTRALCYVDRQLASWRRMATNIVSGQAVVGEDPGGSVADCLILQFTQGAAAVDDEIRMRNSRLADAGQKMARYDYTWDAGRTSTSFVVEGLARTNGGGAEVDRSQTFTTSGGGSDGQVVGTDFTNGRNAAEVRIRRAVAGGAVADDITWAAIMGAYVMGLMLFKGGSERTSGYTSHTFQAHFAVEDLLGRMLPLYDGPNATVDDTAAYGIDQLAYQSGASAADVLEDLMMLIPTHYWAAWERDVDTDLHRFEWRPWPTTVTYEATILDGIDAPGAQPDLYNSVVVLYQDRRGNAKTITRTQTVDALTNAGITRSAFVDLGSEVGSDANAIQAGDNFLAAHATPVNNGTLTIRRPILDHELGRMVDPWEIRAGRLIRVRGLRPNIDSLNASDRNGTTVFRLAETDYDAASNTCRCVLDSYDVPTSRALAALTKRVRRTMRRR